MVKMVKNQKNWAGLYINSTKGVAYISWSFFSNLLRGPRGPVLGGGGGGEGFNSSWRKFSNKSRLL